MFTALQTEYIDNVILAYNPDNINSRHTRNDDDNVKNTSHSTKASPISLGSNSMYYPYKLLIDWIKDVKTFFLNILIMGFRKGMF